MQTGAALYSTRRAEFAHGINCVVGDVAVVFGCCCCCCLWLFSSHAANCALDSLGNSDRDITIHNNLFPILHAYRKCAQCMVTLHQSATNISYFAHTLQPCTSFSIAVAHSWPAAAETASLVAEQDDGRTRWLIDSFSCKRNAFDAVHNQCITRLSSVLFVLSQVRSKVLCVRN